AAERLLRESGRDGAAWGERFRPAGEWAGRASAIIALRFARARLGPVRTPQRKCSPVKRSRRVTLSATCYDLGRFSGRSARKRPRPRTAKANAATRAPQNQYGRKSASAIAALSDGRSTPPTIAPSLNM